VEGARQVCDICSGDIYVHINFYPIFTARLALADYVIVWVCVRAPLKNGKNFCLGRPLHVTRQPTLPPGCAITNICFFPPGKALHPPIFSVSCLRRPAAATASPGWLESLPGGHQVSPSLSTRVPSFRVVYS